MAVYTLRTYLDTHPQLIPSAAGLARQHDVDVKTATRLLKEHNYSLSPDRGGWVYSPAPSTPETDPILLLALALEPYHLLAIDPQIIHKLATNTPPTPPPLTLEDLEEDPDRPDLSLSGWPRGSKEYYVNKVRDLALEDPGNSLRMVVIGLHFILQDGKLPTRAHIAPDGALRPYLTPHTINKQGGQQT